jgi:hypothetical protein
VVSTFNVTPVVMPVMVSVNAALLTQGDPLTVAYRSTGSDGSLAIVPSGGATGSAALTDEVTASSGTLDVDTSAFEPGGYGAVLSGRRRDRGPRVTFWVRDPEAQIEVSTDKATYGVGGAGRRQLDGGPGQPLGLDRCLRGGEG